MKVSNLTSPRTGHAMANQFTVTHDGSTYFQSYNSLCAKYDGHSLTLGRDWDYSVTTMKYLHQWMQKACYFLWKDIMAMGGKSGADSLRRAIEAGVVQYDESMR